jgi:hypothetical protein
VRRVRKAIVDGFLINDEDRKGKAARIGLGEPLLDDVEILPGLNCVGGVCSCAQHSGPPQPRMGQGTAEDGDFAENGNGSGERSVQRTGAVAPRNGRRKHRRWRRRR